MSRLIMGTVLVCFLGSPCAVCAQILYTLESPNPSTDGWFGYSVSDAGDVDGDGHADVVVGAPGEYDGVAHVFGGSDGSLLHTLVCDVGNTYAGFLVSCAGDLDADGYDDLTVSAVWCNQIPVDPYYAGLVQAFSGETGQVLRSWWGAVQENYSDGFGRSTGAAGDVNDDAYDDVVIGQAGWSYYWPYGRVCVFSGSDGVELNTLVSPNPEVGGDFGCSVSGLGDLNGDGCNDILVGASEEDAGATDAGRVYVFSGSDGALLHTLESAYPEDAGYFGCSISHVADVNGDGCADVIVGAYTEDGGAPEAGRAYVFSGLDGSLLYTLASPSPESAGCFGYSVSGAGDVDADGYGDVVVGACGEGNGAPDAGRAYVFSGNGGSLLYVLESSYPQNAGYFGLSVSGAGDMNGDGRSEVIVGAYREDGGALGAGRVYVFNGIEVPVELSSFTAEAQDGHVLLRWSTQTEQDNYGFYLYRAITEPVDYERITADIIPGAGTSTVPHDYSHTDRAVDTGVTYFYRLADVDVQGNQTLHGPVRVTVTPTQLALLGNQPNPFSEATAIGLSLAAPGYVSLRIYNAAGDLVRTLVSGEMAAGTHEIRWDGCDDAGHAVPPGTYTCRLAADAQTQSRGLVLVR